MKSAVVKRSIVIAGHKTSVSLEDAFWDCLKDIAIERDIGLDDATRPLDVGAPCAAFDEELAFDLKSHGRYLSPKCETFSTAMTALRRLLTAGALPLNLE